MISSMTAFARSTYDSDSARYTWEIRSVNHRYAEVFMRMPEDCRGLESELRSSLLKEVKRGKIDCNLRVETTNAAHELNVNAEIAGALAAALREIGELGFDTAHPSSLELLKWPGVVETSVGDPEQLAKDVAAAFRATLSSLTETRQREGEKLERMLLERCDALDEQINLLRDRVPEIINATRDRYTQRIQDFVQDLDKARVEQECALLMQRLDIAEELDRLEAHLDEVRRVIAKGSPAGRRLDFLMQELNREANTVGSKSAHIDSSSTAVELKVLIEQMREQIQNIE